MKSQGRGEGFWWRFFLIVSFGGLEEGKKKKIPREKKEKQRPHAIVGALFTLLL